MAFLTKNELKTHLYEENVDVISRNDETILTAAIDAAVQEAKGYLGDYDVNSVFGATSGDRNALLLVFVKDIAVWAFPEPVQRRHRFTPAARSLRTCHRLAQGGAKGQRHARLAQGGGRVGNPHRWNHHFR